MKLDRATLERAARVVYEAMPPTPERQWPALSERCGADVWVKLENHAPTGAFKVRGGLVFADGLRRRHPEVRGVIAATRGNHGQSVAFAARRAGLAARIVVPHGNSPQKNAAMRGFGAELVEHGADFSESLEHARALAASEGLTFFPSFHEDLVAGVASYALELFANAGPLDTVYVPIGLGSGICGVMAARDARGLDTEIVGVVSEGAPAYALSFEAKRGVASEHARTFADGLAVRVPDEHAVAQICGGASRVVRVSDTEIADAMRIYFDDTRQVAEGAGAASLAALLRERTRMRDRRVGLVLSGGNVDRDVYARVLEGDTPAA